MKTLLDLLMGVGKKKKRDGSRLDNIKLARFAELGKNPRLKLGFSAWTTMASLGP